MRQFSHLTFTAARRSPQVSGLRKTDPDLADDTAEALTNLLLFTVAQFNVSNNLNAAQLSLLANDLLGKFWYWRFDEFAYVFGQALRGKWGTVYNRIDGPVVQEWCEKYGAEREALLVAESEEQAKSYQLAERNGPPEPPLSAAARALVPQLELLSNADLQTGIDYYAALPNPTPEQADKLAAAVAVAEERNRVAWATHMLRQFKAGASGRTVAEREAAAKQKTHAVGVALLQRNWEAAGFATTPSAAWLAKINAPVNEPTDEEPTQQAA